MTQNLCLILNSKSDFTPVSQTYLLYSIMFKRSGSCQEVHLCCIALIQVASRPEIETLFKEWDIEVTEQLLVKLVKEKESRVEEENKLWMAEEDK